jgi:hypothetical protein
MALCMAAMVGAGITSAMQDGAGAVSGGFKLSSNGVFHSGMPDHVLEEIVPVHQQFNYQKLAEEMTSSHVKQYTQGNYVITQLCRLEQCLLAEVSDSHA